MINRVAISRLATKQLRKVPNYIQEALATWIEDVTKDGLLEVRKLPGYHDEPLKGDRQGQRSIRLNRCYRAIYVLRIDNRIEFISVEEVNKHGY